MTHADAAGAPPSGAILWSRSPSPRPSALVWETPKAGFVAHGLPVTFTDASPCVARVIKTYEQSVLASEALAAIEQEHPR